MAQNIYQDESHCRIDKMSGMGRRSRKAPAMVVALMIAFAGSLIVLGTMTNETAGESDSTLGTSYNTGYSYYQYPYGSTYDLFGPKIYDPFYNPADPLGLNKYSITNPYGSTYSLYTYSPYTSPYTYTPYKPYTPSYTPSYNPYTYTPYKPYTPSYTPSYTPYTYTPYTPSFSLY